MAIAKKKQAAKAKKSDRKNVASNIKTSFTVLQVLPRLESGGVERGAVEIVKGLVKAGHKAIVVSEGGRLQYQVESAGAIHVNLPVASKNPFKIVRNARKIAKLIKTYNVNIVHARSRAPAWSCYKACKKTGAKYITTFHGVYSAGNKVKRKYNSIMLKGEKIIAISNFVKEHILDCYAGMGVDTNKITVIHRGVDLDYFDPEKVNSRRLLQMLEKLKLPEDKQIIILPGRFSKWKGHEILLRALTHIDKSKYFCILVGYEDKRAAYRKELEKLIHKLGLIGAVRIISHVSDMPAVYAASNIVVSASTAQPEAFGRVAVEGQAMGKIVVATSHGGSCETILPNKTGLLVEPGNIEAMAEVLKKALSMTDRARKTMCNRARKYVVAEFSLDKMIKKTLKLYADIVS